MQKILIVDDEKALAKALELKIKSSGFATDVASNGEEALEKIQQNSYDLILLDLIMPKKDGFQVLTEMKEKKIQIPTIVSTNLSQVEDEKRARSLGVLDFFVKSNTPLTTVIDKIKQALLKK